MKNSTNLNYINARIFFGRAIVVSDLAYFSNLLSSNPTASYFWHFEVDLAHWLSVAYMVYNCNLQLWICAWLGRNELSCAWR